MREGIDERAQQRDTRENERRKITEVIMKARKQINRRGKKRKQREREGKRRNEKKLDG